MKVLNFSMIKLTVCLVVGILLVAFTPISFEQVLIISGSLLFLFIINYFRVRHRWLQDASFGILAYLLFMSLGMAVWHVHLPENQSTHFINTIETPAEVEISGTVTEVLKSYTNYDNYVLNLSQLNAEVTQGKLLLKVKRDSLTQKLDVDDRLMFKGVIKDIPKPLNPHQFDYSNYMTHQNVLAQSELEASEILVLQTESSTLKGVAHSARARIVTDLQSNGFKDDELGIIKALLLGQKDAISKETYNNYAAAGVVHILAVSGLHVGIVLMILQFLLAPLLRLKYGNILKIAIIIVALWSFAVLAGLSPSVIRAVTMFSFVAVAINLKRRSSTINTLFLSAFVLLLVNPKLVFHVGFQLSYLAVFSIILLQPVLFNLIPRPRFWLLRLYWGVLTVTIAAQVGVLPFSLYYFHQFPGLFFVTNVIIIPFLGLILGYGFLCIFLALIGWLPFAVAEGFRLVITLMNNIIAWIATLEDFLFKDIHFSALQTVVSYLLIVTVLICIRFYRPRNLLYILMAVVIFSSGFIAEKYRIETSEEIVIFHQTAETAIGFKTGTTLNLKTSDFEKENFYLNRALKNYKVGDGFRFIEVDSVKNIYNVFGRKLFVIDSLGVYDKHFSNTMILLRNSPKINLNRLIDSISPTMIVADGSNYKSYVRRWKETAKRKKLPFHHTGEKGAFLIED